MTILFIIFYLVGCILSYFGCCADEHSKQYEWQKEYDKNGVMDEPDFSSDIFLIVLLSWIGIFACFMHFITGGQKYLFKFNMPSKKLEK